MDKSPATRASAAPPAEPRLFGDAERGDTRAKILDAAFRRLATEGYAALSVREIARDAGVNHALINYHFRTKDQLVIAVLDAANQQLLARQAAMYAGAERLRAEVGRGAPLLRERPRLGLRARAGRAVGGEPVQRRAAREVPAAPAGLEAARARGGARGARRRSRRSGVELPRAVQRRGHRLLDLGVLARHGVRRPARREGRASRSTAPRSTPCSRCSNRSMRA